MVFLAVDELISTLSLLKNINYIRTPILPLLQPTAAMFYDLNCH